MTFNELIPIAHEASKAKGFWPEGEKRSLPTLLMLIISECAEALEADRDGRYADLETYDALMAESDNDPGDEVEWFRNCIKDSVDDELSDVVIRLADLCGGLGIEPLQCKYTLNDFKDHSIPAMLYYAVEELAYPDEPTSMRVGGCLDIIELIAERHSIDLWRHVELKLAYNKTRPAKHNKRY